MVFVDIKHHVDLFHCPMFLWRFFVFFFSDTHARFFMQNASRDFVPFCFREVSQARLVIQVCDRLFTFSMHSFSVVKASLSSVVCVTLWMLWHQSVSLLTSRASGWFHDLLLDLCTRCHFSRILLLTELLAVVHSCSTVWLWALWLVLLLVLEFRYPFLFQIFCFRRLLNQVFYFLCS